MLKLALKHGLKLLKVHRILQFKQSCWLNDYIMCNSRQRAYSETSFEKNLFKLMNNAVFGKTMENVRNHVDVKLVSKWEGRYGLQILISKPNFKRNVVFNENLVACELRRLNVYMTKPMIVGTAILEISKCRMYEFHYDFILNYFRPSACQIQYTDTDSFLYNFKCDDFYEFMKRFPYKFDTSDFPENNTYGIRRINKKEIGIMKDEFNGELVKEFIGLRSKMYTIKTCNNKVQKRGKGVKKNILHKQLTFRDYKRCLVEQCNLIKNQTTIKSSLHSVYTITNPKKVLDPFDDKRFIIPNTFNTLAWGHYMINHFDNLNSS